jgi:hypothetical protein
MAIEALKLITSPPGRGDSDGQRPKITTGDNFVQNSGTETRRLPAYGEVSISQVSQRMALPDDGTLSELTYGFPGRLLDGIGIHRLSGRCDCYGLCCAI